MKKWLLPLALLLALLVSAATAEDRPLSEVYNNGLPTVVLQLDESEGTIEAMNSDPDHDTKCTGTVTVLVPEGYTNRYLTKAATSKTYELDYIRGRGNSTWKADKKPYKIKLEKGANLLGMGKGKQWVLMANAYDPTLLRNEFTFAVAEKMGSAFVPKTVSVNLVMNGQYLGVYSLGTPVRIAGNAVDIEELDAGITTEPAITGGYLLSFELSGKEERNIRTSHGMCLSVEEPELGDNGNAAQIAYMADYLEKMESALYGENFRDENGVSYTEYLDVQAAADYFLMQQVSRNSDGIAGGSSYMVKARGGKLCFGPLWDFDYCPWGTQNDGVEGFRLEITNAWFLRLLQDDAFFAVLQERWSVMKEVLTAAIAEDGLLAQLSRTQYGAQEMNYEIWPVIKTIPNPDFNLEAFFRGEITQLPPATVLDENATYDGEIEAMRAWIAGRIAWVDANFDALRDTP